jgi:hypothetical protein
VSSLLSLKNDLVTLRALHFLVRNEDRRLPNGQGNQTYASDLADQIAATEVAIAAYSVPSDLPTPKARKDL